MRPLSVSLNLQIVQVWTEGESNPKKQIDNSTPGTIRTRPSSTNFIVARNKKLPFGKLFEGRIVSDRSRIVNLSIMMLDLRIFVKDEVVKK